MMFYKVKNRYNGYGIAQAPTTLKTPIIIRAMESPHYVTTKPQSGERISRQAVIATSSLGKDEVIILPDDSTSDKIAAGDVGISSATQTNGESSLAVYEGSTMGKQVGADESSDMVQVTEDDLTEKWWSWKSFAIGIGSGIGFCGLIWILSRAAKKGKKR